MCRLVGLLALEGDGGSEAASKMSVSMSKMLVAWVLASKVFSKNEYAVSERASSVHQDGLSMGEVSEILEDVTGCVPKQWRLVKELYLKHWRLS